MKAAEDLSGFNTAFGELITRNGFRDLLAYVQSVLILSQTGNEHLIRKFEILHEMLELSEKIKGEVKGDGVIEFCEILRQTALSLYKYI